MSTQQSGHGSGTPAPNSQQNSQQNSQEYTEAEMARWMAKTPEWRAKAAAIYNPRSWNEKALAIEKANAEKARLEQQQQQQQQPAAQTPPASQQKPAPAKQAQAGSSQAPRKQAPTLKDSVHAPLTIPQAPTAEGTPQQQPQAQAPSSYAATTIQSPPPGPVIPMTSPKAKAPATQDATGPGDRSRIGPDIEKDTRSTWNQQALTSMRGIPYTREDLPMDKRAGASNQYDHLRNDLIPNGKVLLDDLPLEGLITGTYLVRVKSDAKAKKASEREVAQVILDWMRANGIPARKCARQAALKLGQSSASIPCSTCKRNDCFCYIAICSRPVDCAKGGCFYLHQFEITMIAKAFCYAAKDNVLWQAAGFELAYQFLRLHEWYCEPEWYHEAARKHVRSAKQLPPVGSGAILDPGQQGIGIPMAQQNEVDWPDAYVNNDAYRKKKANQNPLAAPPAPPVKAKKAADMSKFEDIPVEFLRANGVPENVAKDAEDLYRNRIVIYRNKLQSYRHHCLAQSADELIQEATEMDVERGGDEEEQPLIDLTAADSKSTVPSPPETQKAETSVDVAGGNFNMGAMLAATNSLINTAASKKINFLEIPQAPTAGGKQAPASSQPPTSAAQDSAAPSQTPTNAAQGSASSPPPTKEGKESNTSA